MGIFRACHGQRLQALQHTRSRDYPNIVFTAPRPHLLPVQPLKKVNNYPGEHGPGAPSQTQRRRQGAGRQRHAVCGVIVDGQTPAQGRSPGLSPRQQRSSLRSAVNTDLSRSRPERDTPAFGGWKLSSSGLAQPDSSPSPNQPTTSPYPVILAPSSPRMLSFPSGSRMPRSTKIFFLSTLAVCVGVHDGCHLNAPHRVLGGFFFFFLILRLAVDGEIGKNTRDTSGKGESSARW